MPRPLDLQQLCDDVLRLLDASDRGFLPHGKFLWHILGQQESREWEVTALRNI